MNRPEAEAWSDSDYSPRRADSGAARVRGGPRHTAENDLFEQNRYVNRTLPLRGSVHSHQHSSDRHYECQRPTNHLELHYSERSAQGLVGYLNRAVKWHIHVQYKVDRARDEQ